MKPRAAFLYPLCVLTLAQVSASPLLACSVQGCLGHGVELRATFAVKVTHDDKPLAEVAVQITRSVDGRVDQVFSGLTSANGKVHIPQLPSGNYWVTAELLGVVAGSECFHVNQATSRKARKEIGFEWGDSPATAHEAAGRLVYTQAGKGGDPLWNRLHPTQTPIRNARLSLRGPQSREVRTTISDDDGQFTFGEIPEGIYVLGVEGASAEAASLLFRVSHSASRMRLFVNDADSFGGRCGGWSIEPDYTSGS